MLCEFIIQISNFKYIYPTIYFGYWLWEDNWTTLRQWIWICLQISIKCDNVTNSKLFCEILMGGIRIALTESFSEVTNISKNVQKYSSKFDGLLHEIFQRNHL